MSETRQRIAQRVHREPGIHFNELARTLDLAPGQVQYHLQHLNDLVADEQFGRTHYYPPDYDEWERHALALLRRETAADVVSVLITNGPTPAPEVADQAGTARSTLAWQVDRLVKADVVEKHRGARNRVTLTVAAPERTAELLAKARPSLPDRMVESVYAIGRRAARGLTFDGHTRTSFFVGPLNAGTWNRDRMSADGSS